MSLFWAIILFVVSFVILLKSADFFTNAAEAAGLRMKISPFILGVTVVSIGTSLPELFTSFIAIARGGAEIVVANAVGSNVANILLVLGVSAAVGGTLIVKRSLIDVDAPLLAISCLIALAMMLDGSITFFESILLVLGYIVYVTYIIKTGRDDEYEIEHDDAGIYKMVKADVKNEVETDSLKEATSWKWITIMLVVGAIGLYLGAEGVIRSILAIGEVLKVSPAILGATAIAIGTSLPEMIVSVMSAYKKQYEVALGNIFGSNIFNTFVVIGLPGLFKTLPIDTTVLTVGLFFMVSATTLIVISSISRRLHRWEGLMYVIFFIVFISKMVDGGF